MYCQWHLNGIWGSSTQSNFLENHKNIFYIFMNVKQKKRNQIKSFCGFEVSGGKQRFLFSKHIRCLTLIASHHVKKLLSLVMPFFWSNKRYFVHFLNDIQLSLNQIVCCEHKSSWCSIQMALFSIYWLFSFISMNSLRIFRCSTIKFICLLFVFDRNTKYCWKDGEPIERYNVMINKNK